MTNNEPGKYRAFRITTHESRSNDFCQLLMINGP